MDERNFWDSSMVKINYILDTYTEQMSNKSKAPAKEITSMRDIAGWV